MALHYDFPYQTTELYCKTCRKSTLHISTNIDHKCNECGRKWDGSLFQVNIKQDEYGRINYECIDLREKPVNSVEYQTTMFEKLDECIDWIKAQDKDLQQALNP